jgi:hypothetical protein
MTMRQQLELHRTNAACRGCHARMDPLGFGLENYDAIGQWRATDGSFPIDASGALPNGETFQGPDGLRQILLRDQDTFARCLASKLFTYALGRKVAIQSVHGNQKFSEIVEAIVMDPRFLSIAGANESR